MLPYGRILLVQFVRSGGISETSVLKVFPERLNGKMSYYIGFSLHQEADVLLS